MESPRKTSRRAFLQGKSTAQAIADATRALREPADGAQPPPENFEAEGYLVRLVRRAMACQFEVILNARQHTEAAEAACAALDRVEELESQLSIYRQSSEISQINARAYDEPVSVEPELFDLLASAAQISRETGGAFDITAGPLARLWGFVARAGTLPDPAELADAAVGSQNLELDRGRKTIRFLRPGMEINLGSIGKGYALDRAAEVLIAAGVPDFFLHGGNSSLLARGAGVDAASTSGWTAGLRNPLRPEQRLGLFHLRDRCLATSGSGTQFFLHQGRRYGHILDPRTRQPAEGVLSATAVAPTAMLADALSTAFYVLGPAQAREFCRSKPEVGFVLLVPGKLHATVEIETAGLAEGEFELLATG